MSFAAIQQLQLEQNTPSKKDKRSLKEIQEEETARQVEDDFMRWWAAEEARLQAEQPEASAAPKPRKVYKPRKKQASAKGDPRPSQEEAQNARAGNSGSIGDSTKPQEIVKDKSQTERKDGSSTPRSKRKPPPIGRSQEAAVRSEPKVN